MFFCCLSTFFPALCFSLSRSLALSRGPQNTKHNTKAANATARAKEEPGKKNQRSLESHLSVPPSQEPRLGDPLYDVRRRLEPRLTLAAEEPAPPLADRRDERVEGRGHAVQGWERDLELEQPRGEVR